MPELNENDLHKLFRASGHHVPSRDLTDRIMAQVAVTSILRPTAVRPLIPAKAWGIIGLTLGALVLFLMGAASATTSPGGQLDVMLRSAFGGLSMPAGNWPLWSAGGSFCLLVLVMVDRAMARRVEPVRR